jgi:WD40 repeat protein
MNAGRDQVEDCYRNASTSFHGNLQHPTTVSAKSEQLVMKSRPLQIARRFACWGIGLLLVPGALLSLVLFCMPGEVKPSMFVPADQLWFTVTLAGERKGKPFLTDVSPSGRCFVTDDLEDNQRDETKMRIFDTVTMKLLSTILAPKDVLPIDLIPGCQKFLYCTRNRLHVKELSSELLEPLSVEITWPESEQSELYDWVSFSRDTRHLLIRLPDEAVLYDLPSHRTLSTFRANENRELSHCFFDSANDPRALVLNPDLDLFEVWEIASNQMVFSLDQSELRRRSLREVTRRQYGTLAFGRSIVASVHGDRSLVLVRSLDDGHTLQSYSFPGKNIGLVRISADDRLLVFNYEHPDPLVELAGHQLPWLSHWLEKQLASKDRLGIIDLQGGKIWRNLAGYSSCAFTEDGTRLIAFTEEGRYEYDLPLRRESFSIWAWAALAAWLSLFSAWWRLLQIRYWPGSLNSV